MLYIFNIYIFKVLYLTFWPFNSRPSVILIYSPWLCSNNGKRSETGTKTMFKVQRSLCKARAGSQPVMEQECTTSCLILVFPVYSLSMISWLAGTCADSWTHHLWSSPSVNSVLTQPLQAFKITPHHSCKLRLTFLKLLMASNVLNLLSVITSTFCSFSLNVSTLIFTVSQFGDFIFRTVVRVVVCIEYIIKFKLNYIICMLRHSGPTIFANVPAIKTGHLLLCTYFSLWLNQEDTIC